MGSFGAGSTDYNDPSKQRSRRSILLNSTESPFYTPPASETTAPASTGYQPNRRSVIIRPEEVAALQEGRSYAPRTTFDSDDEEADAVADALSALEGKGSLGHRSSLSANKAPHRRSVSNVDLGSLAEFASKLPSHMQPGAGSAAFQNFGQSQVNNDDIDRRRYTTAFNSLTPSRTSVLASGLTSTTTANRRLSSMAPSKDLDRKDWRMCKLTFDDLIHNAAKNSIPFAFLLVPSRLYICIFIFFSYQQPSISFFSNRRSFFLPCYQTINSYSRGF